MDSKRPDEIERLLFVFLLNDRAYGGGVCSLADAMRLRALGVSWDGSYRATDMQEVNKLKIKT